MPLIQVSRPVKARIDEMQAERVSALDRQVTQSEIIETLIAMYDTTREAAPKWPADENRVPR